VSVRDSRRRVSSAACSHSSRTAVRAAAEAVKVGLRKSSCRSSPSNRRTVASSTRASSRPRRDSAQSVRATGSGRAPALAQRRTASAAAAGSSLQSPSGAGSWPVVAAPSPVSVPPSGREPDASPSARCTAPRSSAGSRPSAPCAAAATSRDSTTSSRAAYSSRVLPRSTCPPPVASCLPTARTRVDGAIGSYAPRAVRGSGCACAVPYTPCAARGSGCACAVPYVFWAVRVLGWARPARCREPGRARPVRRGHRAG
jgi:hypothetical protein